MNAMITKGPVQIQQVPIPRLKKQTQQQQSPPSRQEILPLPARVGSAKPAIKNVNSTTPDQLNAVLLKAMTKECVGIGAK